MGKKVYVKPSVYMERFEVSQHVADCAWELNSAYGTCGYVGDLKFGFEEIGIIINGDTSGCEVTDWTDYCETLGGENHNTFNS